VEGERTEPAKLVGGRYALESLLGTGGMGEVWRARHVALNTLVAIKFLHGASAQRLSTRKRFLTEAQVTAQLKTRHAVQVFDFGVTDDGQPYLVMELLDGETLGHRITRQTRLAIGTTVRFLEQAARALERAHAVGIVHRDFKPDNIVISLDEEGNEHVKVLDFGIAKLLNELEADSVEDDRDASTDVAPAHAKAFATFTKTGTILGTPLYMSPEQVRNSADLDLRADIWAFGVVAFQCLTGIPPFEGKNLIQLFERITTGIHPRARSINPELPEAFDDWFDTACAPDATKRFASAKAAAAHLATALDARDFSVTAGITADTSSGRELKDNQSNTSSGERASFPVDKGLAHATQAAHAETIEAGVASVGRIVSSERQPASEVPQPNRLGRVPRSMPPPSTDASISTRSRGSEHAEHAQHTSVSDSGERLPSKRAKRRALLLGASAMVALVVFATWRVGARRNPLSPTMPVATSSAMNTATTATATLSAADVAAVIPSASSAPSTPAASASAPVTAIEAPTTPPIARGTPVHARPSPLSVEKPLPSNPSAASTTTATANASATTSASPVPPRPSAPAASAASPFKLPPLGI
jgi:serine/threonine protein kinase